MALDGRVPATISLENNKSDVEKKNMQEDLDLMNESQCFPAPVRCG